MTGLSILAVVGALVAFLLAHRMAGRVAGGLAAVLVLGQAATLRLIEAGPVVAYEHFRSPRMYLEHPVALGLVLLEVVVVLLAAVRERSRLVRMGREAPRWLLVAIVLVASVTAVAPSADPRRYALEIAIGGGHHLVAIANVLLLVLAIPESAFERLSDWWERVGSNASGTIRPVRAGLALALATTLACALLSIVVYQRHPHVPDEVSYLLHARYFAAGRLEMPAPPVGGAFDLDLMRLEPTRWYSPVPPGWPAVLALGAAAGVPWLVNPILAGIGVLLSCLLAWRIYDRRTALVAAVLLATSPWYLFLGMSFMTHLASFVFAVGAAYAVACWRDSGRTWLPLAAGGLAGAVGLVRPLEAVVVGGLLGSVLLVLSIQRRIVRPLVAFAGGAVAVSSVVLPYNAHLTGSPTRFPIMVYTDALYGPGTNALGFGPERGLGWTGLDPFPGHGLIDVIVNTVLNVHAIDIELFGWATGAWFFLLAGVWLIRRTATDAAVVAAFALPVVLHAFYWFAGGPDFGARYWFLAILPLALLAARPICAAKAPRVRVGSLVVAGALTWASVVTFIPWRATDKYDGYRGMRPWARSIARDPNLSGALLLVRGKQHPDFASAATYNPIDVRTGGPVFAWDRDAATRDSLLAAYPDRPVYVLEGPTVTGGAPRLFPYDGSR